MNKEEKESCYLPIDWSDALVEDFKRDIFDVYFQDEFSVSQWKKVLTAKKRPAGMQTCRVAYDNTARKLKLNNAELGRLCYILQMTCTQFNSIFATSITASNIPSSYSSFCKQSENTCKTNIYRLGKEILERHNLLLFAPKMNAEDLSWERRAVFARLDEADESDREMIAFAQKRIESRQKFRENAQKQFDRAERITGGKKTEKTSIQIPNHKAEAEKKSDKKKTEQRHVQTSLF